MSSRKKEVAFGLMEMLQCMCVFTMDQSKRERERERERERKISRSVKKEKKGKVHADPCMQSLLNSVCL